MKGGVFYSFTAKNLLMKLHFLTILISFGILACNTPEEDKEQPTHTEIMDEDITPVKELAAYLKIETIAKDHFIVIFVENYYERILDEVMDGYAEQISPDDFKKLGLPEGTVSAILLERTHHAPTEYFYLIQENGQFRLSKGGYFGEIDWQEKEVNLQLIGLWSSDTKQVNYLEFTASKMYTTGLEGGDYYSIEGNKIYCTTFGDKFYTINSLTDENLIITDPFGDKWNMYKANSFD
jgi:hypothetical protein